MDRLFYITATLTIFFAISMLSLLVLSRTSRATSQRVLDVTQGRRSAEHAAKIIPRLQIKFFATAYWLRSHLSMSENPLLLRRFVQAGVKSTSGHDVYVAARVFGPITAFGLGFFVPSHRIFWMVAVAGICYLTPDIFLQQSIRWRREKIRLSIPDTVDLLVICVDAGLGIDQAMLRVGQELGNSHPEIYEEFLQINREQRAGKLRLTAWQEMAQRNNLPDLDSLVNMLMQTERFGTPIARALSTFADGIRQRRRQKAEELAAKTTIKIIFPLVLFIFPSMFIVLLGPAGISIARGFTGFGQ